MESNHNPHYEKLDLDPFTFSSPNSAGWNDLELKNFLEDKKQKAVIEKKIPENSSPLQSDTLVELSLNEVEAFAQLSQEKSPDNLNNRHVHLNRTGNNHFHNLSLKLTKPY